MAHKAISGLLSVRINQDVIDDLQDCADAEGKDFADVLREILSNAAKYRIKKLRKRATNDEPARPTPLRS